MKGVRVPVVVQREIVVPDRLKVGAFANAFRVVEEAGPDCFLDFLAYSAQEERLEVVSRVRVRRELLPEFRELLEEVESDFRAPLPTGTN